jgi:triosephosphate isomerase
MIAYEPVWAIGTGEVASVDDIAAMHQAIASELPKSQNAHKPPLPILYGGSVNDDNAKTIFAIDHVGGALVGGASLDAVAFDSICESAVLQILKS